MMYLQIIADSSLPMGTSSARDNRLTPSIASGKFLSRPRCVLRTVDGCLCVQCLCAVSVCGVCVCVSLSLSLSLSLCVCVCVYGCVWVGGWVDGWMGGMIA